MKWELKVILRKWTTISVEKTAYSKKTFLNIIKFLKDNCIKFFYTILFENNINIIKIRILEKDYDIFSECFLKEFDTNILINCDYNPEILRYGGMKNIYQIEEIFCKASLIQSEYIFSNNFYKKILLALELNRKTFELLEINNNELKKIYLFLSNIWMKYTRNKFGMKIKGIQDICDNLFEKIIKEEVKINKENFNKYIFEINKINDFEFINIVSENPEYSQDLKEFLKENNINKNLFNIIISIAHMNFNRLELYPHLECVIYKILSEKEFKYEG